MAICQLSAQNSSTATSHQSGDGSSPVLYGTNVNLEGSPATKGAQLGLGAHQEDKNVKKKKKRRGEFAIAPIPLINPSIGNGAGLGVLYAVHLDGDESSSPSTFGLAGFGTGRGSWGGGLGAQLHLKHDAYRITIGGGGGRFNYNYFGTGTAGGNAGISIPLSQKSKAFLIEPKIRFLHYWYAGPRYHIISSQVSLNSTKLDPSKLPIPLPSDIDLRTAAFGGRLQRDTSDSSFYPRTGSIFDALGDLYGSAVGGKRTYQNLTLSYDKYFPLKTKNVVAIHATACLVTNKAPFYDLCELGLSKDLRGYQIGQFRDNRMLVGQAEFRRDLFWRLGAVAFAGAGAVAHTWDGFGDTDAKPGGGLGLRFILAKRNHINLRVDYAWGEQSKATYVSIGEAF
jgi:outer membrane protein assembly factor BamA